MGKKAVVLSGGGSKGAYQMGVWKALRRLHYHYDIVTGTSVGALNGVMMVQRDYRKCLKLWKNMNFDKLFIDKFPSNVDGIIGTTKVYQKYVSSFFKNGGINISRFENLVYQLYNPFRFFHSSINFGIVTYNLSSFKTVEISKRNMTKKNAPHYIIASASCFPAFPTKKIDGKDYIDGGYSDVLPIHLAIELGATEIVAVDLNAVGRRKKTKTDGVKVTLIEPRNQIASFLVFNQNLSRKAICYGYNDTMKVFGKLKGNMFTFYPYSYRKEYLKCAFRLKEELLLRLDVRDNKVQKQLLKLSLFHKLLHDKTGEKREKLFYEIIELIGKNLKIDDTRIYRMKDFRKEILNKFSNIDSFDIKKMEENIKNKNIKNLFGTSIILRFLYDRIKNVPETKKEKKEYCNYALLFPKEFIAAMYLILLGGNET